MPKKGLVSKASQEYFGDYFGFYLERAEKSSENCEWKSDTFNGHFQKITVDVKRGGKCLGTRQEAWRLVKRPFLVHIEMVVAWTRAGVQNILRSGQMNLHLGRRAEGKFNK